MSKRIQKILNKIDRMRLCPEWSDYWQELYDKAPFRVRKHFVLEQFISPILSTKEFLRERDVLEATLTEKEWSYLIWNFCGLNEARIAYDKRMKKHHPEFNVHRANSDRLSAKSMSK